VKSGGSFDRAIIGAGPVGLIAALQSSRSSPTLLVCRAPAEPEPGPRLETVPAALVSLLMDFGVDPKRIGIDRLYDARHVAWESHAPTTTAGRAVAHIEHGALQTELLSIARRHPNLSVQFESQLPVKRQGYWCGTSWRARTLLDATGRAMAFARRRVRPPKPWVARPFWTQSSSATCDRSLRIAALPFGYVYRLASSHIDMVWVAGRGSNLGQSAAALERTLKSAGAHWLLEGFPSLATASTGRAYTASVQWSENSPCAAVGDAVLARDILSSQGLATGISDALYAVASQTQAEAKLRVDRQVAERAAHLRSLAQLFASCRYRDRDDWMQYFDFVTSHQSASAAVDGAALVSGRIVRRAVDRAAAPRDTLKRSEAHRTDIESRPCCDQ
jgi:2-polyprenyl-6-methoxyphenol hydroxylase-like FAD-dependent oxidoreductase